MDVTSTWDEVSDFIHSGRVVALLLLVAAVVTAVGYLVYHPSASGALAPLVVAIQSYRLGWVAVAYTVVGDESVASLAGLAAMSLFTTLLVYAVVKPVFTVETLAKAAIVIGLLAVLAAALYTLYHVASTALPGWRSWFPW